MCQAQGRKASKGTLPIAPGATTSQASTNTLSSGSTRAVRAAACRGAFKEAKRPQLRKFDAERGSLTAFLSALAEQRVHRSYWRQQWRKHREVPLSRQIEGRLTTMNLLPERLPQELLARLTQREEERVL